MEKKWRDAGVAAFTQAVLGRRMVETAHKWGVRADAGTSPDSLLRDPTLQRIVLGGLAALDVGVDNVVLKTIFPTLGEMFAVAFIDGKDEAKRHAERYRADALKRIQESDNPEAEEELLERRLGAMNRIIDAGVATRKAIEEGEGDETSSRSFMETLRERYGSDDLPENANVLDVIFAKFDGSAEAIGELARRRAAEREVRIAGYRAEHAAKRHNRWWRRFFRWLFRRNK